MYKLDQYNYWVDPKAFAQYISLNHLEACKLNESSQTHIISTNSSEINFVYDEIKFDQYYQFTLSNVLYIMSKFRYLFYLVWPTETMFPSINLVPRYVTEVSRIIVIPCFIS